MGEIVDKMASHTTETASHSYLTSALYLHKPPNDMLWNAASSGDDRNLKRALGGRAGINATDKYNKGETALHKAADSGHSSVVVQLLDSKADCNVLDRMHGASALHRAAGAGHASVVVELVRRGANLLLTDCNGDTALHWAAAAGHARVFEALVQFEPLLDAKNMVGYTALMKAAQAGHLPVLESLLASGADIFVQDNKYGWTALHIAAVDAQADVVEALIKAGADPNQKDAGRCTSLQIAATPELRLLMSRVAAEMEMQAILDRGASPYL